ncbi:hypothetical protein BT63DRAFT_457493 [Microthyrium microscopicum]|uniref:Uncharacterized protein n=1 Tax=Microthyrium microscopicum TaxID=703497 RepID=A0A6A6U5I5_9PEZI|nr:hypothetical protein BT63DRAFT_457493 [Microthyrium microscopicum]
MAILLLPYFLFFLYISFDFASITTVPEYRDLYDKLSDAAWKKTVSTLHTEDQGDDRFPGTSMDQSQTKHLHSAAMSEVGNAQVESPVLPVVPKPSSDAARGSSQHAKDHRVAKKAAPTVPPLSAMDCFTNRISFKANYRDIVIRFNQYLRAQGKHVLAPHDFNHPLVTHEIFEHDWTDQDRRDYDLGLGLPPLFSNAP